MSLLFELLMSLQDRISDTSHTQNPVIPSYGKVSKQQNSPVMNRCSQIGFQDLLAVWLGGDLQQLAQHSHVAHSSTHMATKEVRKALCFPSALLWGKTTAIVFWRERLVTYLKIRCFPMDFERAPADSGLERARRSQGTQWTVCSK